MLCIVVALTVVGKGGETAVGLLGSTKAPQLASFDAEAALAEPNG